MLTKLSSRFFGYTNASPRQLQKMIQESTQKLKHRRTAADLSGMKSFIKSTAQSGKMGNLINKTSRLDSQMDHFMDELSRKNDFSPDIDAEKLKPEEAHIARTRANNE